MHLLPFDSTIWMTEADPPNGARKDLNANNELFECRFDFYFFPFLQCKSKAQLSSLTGQIYKSEIKWPRKCYGYFEFKFLKWFLQWMKYVQVLFDPSWYSWEIVYIKRPTQMM